MKMHPCEFCGQLTVNPRFCSKLCVGKWLGHKNVKSGEFTRIRELPQTKAAQRENGRKLGRKNVESGQLASVASLGGKIAGRKAVENGVDFAALGRIGGRISGRKAVENGRLAFIILKNPSRGQVYFGEQLRANPRTSRWTGERISLPDGTWVIPDYSFRHEKVIIELDGVYYHTESPARMTDSDTRDRKLADFGWCVIHIPYTTMANLKRDAPAWIEFIAEVMESCGVRIRIF